MTDQPNLRVAALEAAAQAISADGYWLPPDGQAAAVDAVLALTGAELETSQRRGIRIQTLLDEQRDKARKDAAASRESERQLQQQIDQQAKEIDRLRDQAGRLRSLAAELENANAYGGEMDGYNEASRLILAALEPPEETP